MLIREENLNNSAKYVSDYQSILNESRKQKKSNYANDSKQK